MRLAAAALSLALSLIAVTASPASAQVATAQQGSAEAVLGWINQYRFRPEPQRVPEAIRTAGRAGVLKDTESSGVYIGFLAGVLNANPARAETIIEKTLPLPPDQQWAIVRAVAYSGVPNWKGLLHGYKMHMPSRAAMIDMYLNGKLATLDQLVIDHDKPSFLAKLFAREEPSKPVTLEPTPDVLDTLWGFYFATGAFAPIGKLVSMLQWANEEDEVELLTLGGMAKYTLATNAARNPELLKMLKWTVRYQDKATAKVLQEVIAAADGMETAKIRRDALAAIENLKRKGPGSKRKLAGWGQIGQGALALGCIGAAAAGAVALGLPCVIGGAASSAALNAITTSE